jgi:hypothetical protein
VAIAYRELTCLLVRMLLLLLLVVTHNSSTIDHYGSRCKGRIGPPLTQLITRNCPERILSLTYIAAERTWTCSKHISRDTEPIYWRVGQSYINTTFSIVACWTLFTELLPGNPLIKSVTILMFRGKSYFIFKQMQIQANAPVTQQLSDTSSSVSAVSPTGANLI